jgi:uncharacterized protein DUF4032
VKGGTDFSELYCQVLEHKWFLSEREKKDVGMKRAIEDYLALRKRQQQEEERAKAKAPEPASASPPK